MQVGQRVARAERVATKGAVHQDAEYLAEAHEEGRHRVGPQVLVPSLQDTRPQRNTFDDRSLNQLRGHDETEHDAQTPVCVVDEAWCGAHHCSQRLSQDKP